MDLKSAPQLKTGIRWPGILGIIATVGLLGGGTAWATLTEISGAVIAIGSVEVTGRPKSVQHLDGGVLEELRVNDGQSVDKGEVLALLDDTTLKANLLIYKTRLSEAVALRDRLIAEQHNEAEIAFQPPEPMIADMDTDLHRAGQTQIFTARRELEVGRKQQLSEKIVQFENQTRGVEALIDAKEQQLVLVETELASVKSLTEKGLARASQLLGLQRNQADLLGQVAEHGSELARIQNSIRDTEIEMLQGERQTKEQVVTELRETVTGIHELRQQIASTQKQLERVTIRAPNAGRIHEMQVTTIGGVLPPGGTLLQIVPMDEGMVFRTRIDTIAVDQVYVGQPAKIRFSAFNQRTTPELQGSVADISATSVLDEVTGAQFYWVIIAIPDSELDRLGDLDLVPGMPVEAYIATNERTVLNYLTKPLTEQLNQAFREE